MNELISKLEAAIAAEKNKTPALSVAASLLASLKARLAEHQAIANPKPETPNPKPAQS